MNPDVTSLDYRYGDGAPPRERRAGERKTTRLVRNSLLPVSLILWGVGVLRTDTASLGPYGLLPALPLVFYLGVLLLIVSVGLELARPEPSQLRLGLHSGCLVLMLYGTSALVYSAGRYAWLYKTIGIVQRVSATGHFTPGLDIYQSWPGFFALASWFDRVAGVSTPLDYAKWWQLIVELAALPLLYSIYRSLALGVRQRWLGLLLYSAGNWIGQDYFSPQSLSTILSLGIFAIVLRWMVAGNSPGHLTRDHGTGSFPAVGGKRRWRRGPTPLERRGAIPFLAALLLLFFVLVFTHELSPYIVTAQFIALAAVGQMRPRWIPVGVLVITIAYLAPNFSYVNSHFGLVSSFGNFFGNVASPSQSDAGTMPESQHILGDCSSLLSLGMWGLAIIGAWRRRSSRRTAIALLFLTFSPVLVLVGGGYGNEGILRVYLFSLPWAAALAASALLPLRSLSQTAGYRDDDAGPYRWRWRGFLARFDRGTVLAPVVLACVLVLFFPAFYGSDGSNMMPQSQLDATTAFQEHATPGIVMFPMDNATLYDTANYDQWPGEVIFGGGVLDVSPEKTNIATYLARTAVNYTNALEPSYVMITPSMLADITARGYTTPASVNELLAQLRVSRYWKLIVNTDGTMIYQLTPAANDIPPGPYNAQVSFSVP